MILLAGAAGATSERTLTGTFPVEAIESVSIEAGVGDIDITTIDSAVVEVEVRLTPRRGGIFSSMKHAEQEVEEASLLSESIGSRRYLEVDSSSGERRFEERWTIHLPARLAVEVDLGLGDVTVIGLRGGTDIEVGVGDVTLEAVSGDLFIEVGVGDVTATAESADFGNVESSGGVGDSQLRVRGKRISSEGMVGHSASWQGDGGHRLEIEVGVGKAKVTLN
jgi:hypothetical protein